MRPHFLLACVLLTLLPSVPATVYTSCPPGGTHTQDILLQGMEGQVCEMSQAIEMDTPSFTLDCNGATLKPRPEMFIAVHPYEFGFIRPLDSSVSLERVAIRNCTFDFSLITAGEPYRGITALNLFTQNKNVEITNNAFEHIDPYGTGYILSLTPPETLEMQGNRFLDFERGVMGIGSVSGEPRGKNWSIRGNRVSSPDSPYGHTGFLLRGNSPDLRLELSGNEFTGVLLNEGVGLEGRFDEVHLQGNRFFDNVSSSTLFRVVADIPKLVFSGNAFEDIGVENRSTTLLYLVSPIQDLQILDNNVSRVKNAAIVSYFAGPGDLPSRQQIRGNRFEDSEQFNLGWAIPWNALPAQGESSFLFSENVFRDVNRPVLQFYCGGDKGGFLNCKPEFSRNTFERIAAENGYGGSLAVTYYLEAKFTGNAFKDSLFGVTFSDWGSPGADYTYSQFWLTGNCFQSGTYHASPNGQQRGTYSQSNNAVTQDASFTFAWNPVPPNSAEDCFPASPLEPRGPEGIPNNPPSAQFVAIPRTGITDLWVDFDASASTDPDGDVLSYEWDFGDGARKMEGPSTNHLYTSPGLFQASLTVKDGRGGEDTETKTVNPTAEASIIGLEAANTTTGENSLITLTCSKNIPAQIAITPANAANELFSQTLNCNSTISLGPFLSPGSHQAEAKITSPCNRCTARTHFTVLQTVQVQADESHVILVLLVFLAALWMAAKPRLIKRESAE